MNKWLPNITPSILISLLLGLQAPNLAHRAEIAQGEHLGGSSPQAEPAIKEFAAPITRRQQLAELIRFSPDGRLLAVVGRGTINLWDTKTWQLKTTLHIGTEAYFSHLTFSPSSSLIAVAGGEYNPKREERYVVAAWNLTSNAPQFVTPLPQRCEFLGFSPDSTSIAAACFEPRSFVSKLIRVDIKNGAIAEQTELGESSLPSIAQSPDGRFLVLRKRLSLTVFRSDDLQTRVADLGQPGYLEFAPGGSHLAICHNGRFRVIDTKMWTEAFNRNLQAVFANFSPDGRYLLVICGNWPPNKKIDLVRILETRTVRELTTFRINTRRIRCAEWSPDNSTLAFGVDKDSIRLFKILNPASRSDQR